MNRQQKQQLVEYLSGFVTGNKLAKFDEVLNRRTRHVTVALEDIYLPHNASAVIRSCDLFGIQDVHVIENRNRYTINPGVTLGSSKWINLNHYNSPDTDNSTACITCLKSKGYRIIATSPHRDDRLLSELPVDHKFALLFGTEETGLTEKALEMADEFIRIPMFGFTESFNISVSVAICLYDVITRLRASDLEIGLSDEEKLELKLVWLRKSLRRHKLLEKKFLERIQEGGSRKITRN